MERRILIAVIVIIALLSEQVAVAASVDLSGVTHSIGNIFDGFFKMYDRDANGNFDSAYKLQRKLVDFSIFFIIFLSVSWIGLTRAFGEKGGSSGAAKALAVSIGLALAVSIVAFSDLSLAYLFPFARNLLFLLAFIVIYFLLLKMGLDKHKVWAFILAVLITVLLFMLYNLGKNGTFGFPSISGGPGIGTLGLGGIFSGNSPEQIDAEIAKLNNQIAQLDRSDPNYASNLAKLQDKIAGLEKKKSDAVERQRRESIKLVLQQKETEYKSVLRKGDPSELASYVQRLKIDLDALASVGDTTSDEYKLYINYMHQMNSSLTSILGSKYDDAAKIAEAKVGRELFFTAKTDYESMAKDFSATKYPGTPYEENANTRAAELDVIVKEKEKDDSWKRKMLNRAQDDEDKADKAKKDAYWQAKKGPSSIPQLYRDSDEYYAEAQEVYEELSHYPEFGTGLFHVNRHDSKQLLDRAAKIAEERKFVQTGMENANKGTYIADEKGSGITWWDKNNVGKKWYIYLPFMLILMTSGFFAVRHKVKQANRKSTPDGILEVVIDHLQKTEEYLYKGDPEKADPKKSHGQVKKVTHLISLLEEGSASPSVSHTPTGGPPTIPPSIGPDIGSQKPTDAAGNQEDKKPGVIASPIIEVEEDNPGEDDTEAEDKGDGGEDE